MKVDFHCHSNHSDGELSPQQLIQIAREENIKYLSITDHDCISAYHNNNLNTDKLQLISGIELSTYWRKLSIHIVGLGFDINSQHIQNAVKLQNTARANRAGIIAQKLEKKTGLKNILEELHETKIPSRPDFAELLLKKGIVNSTNEAFKKYLGSGKIGDVKNIWLSLQEVIDIIANSGGIAVLAHPLYYKLTNTKLNQLLTDFKLLGGKALEIINGYQNRQKTEYLIQLCQHHDLLASAGSDFHFKSRWNRLGIETGVVKNDSLNWIYDEF